MSSCTCSSTRKGDRITLALCEPCRLLFVARDAPPAVSVGYRVRDDFDLDYIKGTPGDALRTPGGYDDVPYPPLDGILDEALREPMPVVELPEVPE